MPREVCVRARGSVRGGAGEGAEERPRGLGRGGLVERGGALRGGGRKVMEVRRWDGGVGRGEGLELREKSRWSTRALEFQRGL